MTVLSSVISTSVEGLVRDLASETKDQRPAFIVAFASPAHSIDDLAKGLVSTFDGTCVLCASSAGEFTEGGDAKQSISAVAVAGDFRVFGGMGVGLKANAEAAVQEALAGLPRSVPGYPHCTAILLLDPLSGVGEEASLLVAALLGPEVQLAGGAAGDDLAMQHTRVSSGQRVAEDALAIALVFSKLPLAIGVSHGHSPISDKLEVTRAEGNVVYTVAGKPAWDVWRDQTRSIAKTRGLDPDNLPPGEVGAYLLRYQAGLAFGDDTDPSRATFKIRAPLAILPDGALSFACGIPQGSVIRIMESVAEEQVDAAIRAARMAKEHLAGSDCAGAIVFDCICRKLILGDSFVKAVKGISTELGDARIGGFETYGEIALYRGEMSGFHNTTSVVLAFPR